MDYLKTLCEQYIPKQVIVTHAQSHPWLDVHCAKAIQKKAASEGTDSYALEQESCAEVLKQAYAKYLDKLKERISKLSKSDKLWWVLNRELLHKRAKTSSIPPLRTEDGQWHLEAKAKADFFAEAFGTKYTLPVALADQFVATPDFWQFSFVAIRTRTVLHLLSHIDVNKATGPDGLPGRIIKELAKELAIPITILCRRMLKEACLPQIWRDHLIAPLYKRESIYNREHYRCVHLTTTISKVRERAIGNPLMMFLQNHGYGDAQWIFRKQSSSRDLVLVSVTHWINAICAGYKIGTYLGGHLSRFRSSR